MISNQMNWSVQPMGSCHIVRDEFSAHRDLLKLLIKQIQGNVITLWYVGEIASKGRSSVQLGSYGTASTHALTLLAFPPEKIYPIEFQKGLNICGTQLSWK